MLSMLMLVALAAGCARLGIGPGAGNSAGAPDPTGAWVLTSGSGPLGPIVVPDGWRVTLVFDDQGAHGQACNWYGGTYELDGSSVHFAPMTMTEMACEEPMMTVEGAYHQALAAVDTLERNGDQLFLTGPDVELAFELQQPLPDAGLEGTHWILESLILGDAVSSVQGSGWLELRGGGELAGSTGCRELAGRFVVDGDRVLTTELRASGSCDPALTQQDATVIEVLEAGFRVQIDGSRLTLTRTDGTGLGYLAPAPD